MNNTTIIDSLGDLYVWGNAENDQFGLKIELAEYIIKPTILPFFKDRYLKVTEIALGESHIIVVAKKKDSTQSEVGDLYSWGLDICGRLGYLSELFGDKDEEVPDGENYVFRRTPTLLSLPDTDKDKISRVTCGKDFSACLTENGRVYSWGNNKWGNLGHKSINTTGYNYTSTPKLIDYLSSQRIIQIVCGDKHMMALSYERRIFSWGEGKDGALGHNNFEGTTHPMLIKALSSEDIIFIAAGDNASAAINSKGHLYTWGDGKHGRLGLGSKDKSNQPMKVVDGILTDRVFIVSIGYYHSICSTCM